MSFSSPPRNSSRSCLLSPLEDPIEGTHRQDEDQRQTPRVHKAEMIRRRGLRAVGALKVEGTRMAVQTTTDFNARFLERLEKRRYFRHIVIVPEQAPCAVCIGSPHVVERAELPILPHRDCTRNGGCECWYAASSRDPAGVSPGSGR